LLPVIVSSAAGKSRASNCPISLTYETHQAYSGIPRFKNAIDSCTSTKTSAVTSSLKDAATKTPTLLHDKPEKLQQLSDVMMDRF
jgi:hypothetical protein